MALWRNVCVCVWQRITQNNERNQDNFKMYNNKHANIYVFIEILTLPTTMTNDDSKFLTVLGMLDPWLIDDLTYKVLLTTSSGYKAHTLMQFGNVIVIFSRNFLFDPSQVEMFYLPLLAGHNSWSHYNVPRIWCCVPIVSGAAVAGTTRFPGFLWPVVTLSKTTCCHHSVCETLATWSTHRNVILTCHDDVIKWKHFPCYWPFVWGIHRSPVNSHHKGQWRGALMYSLVCAWINGLVNNREAGDLRRHRAHYDIIDMWKWFDKESNFQ